MYIFETTLFGIHIAPTWYGFMYALGFISCYAFIKRYGKLRGDDIDTLLTYVFFGVILGGRIGYILFYNFNFFFENPKEIIAIWKGGMSFHGGLIGVITAVYMFARRYKYSFFEVIDPLAVIIPTALFFGRIGNYINGELLGYSPYTGALAIYKNGIGHFPSTLLEASLEGIMLFIFMLLVWKNGRKYNGKMSGMFLIGYGTARFISEFFRLPDSHIGYLVGSSWLTLGMIYTLPLFMVGIFILIKYSKKTEK